MTIDKVAHLDLTIVAAVAKNGTIGNDGKLPWHHAADMAHFRKLTMGGTVIMGRKTYDSIGHPLPGRRNIIISRTQIISGRDCLTVASPSLAVVACHLLNIEHAFIIGGAQIYSDMAKYVSKAVISRLPYDVEGDTKMPELPPHINIEYVELE
jgi:dihydrofolate reductase